jgi:hypothetical protein
MYRLMTYLPTLQHLLISALSSVKSIMNLVVFLLIVALCFNVTGRYLFGNQVLFGAFFASQPSSTFPVAMMTHVSCACFLIWNVICLERRFA